ncbi:MAG: cobalamin biosynthesis protein, partial [Verrucomicrobiota bacterium]
CRRGVSLTQIKTAVNKSLKAAKRSLNEVREVATIDAKANEISLRQWCASNELPLRIFSRKLVSSRPWIIQPSPWVKQTLGVDGVCEPCALLASPHGELISNKTAHNGVTVAIAADLEKTFQSHL